ncbi:Hint domain-containing protein [Mameliella alba]|uniref:Iron-regulated protein frpC n=1 Tax=Mameliella alba TaxID=561184 RepID=A0A0B3RQ79_9RHOB|nr:Hint domain-containing protein [Mameliella alba]KHQ49982.1 Iron-regulated protein frpC [Mameliella alba]
MAITYTTEGYIGLSGVTITGGQGQPGSTLSWTGLYNFADEDDNYPITDVDEDGLLDAGTDWFVGDSVDFTGYTITIGGVEYPVFLGVGGYGVPLPQNGSTQTLIPSSGTTNAYQAEAQTYLCFAAGTEIAGPEGARPVEDLRIGDMILTADGRAVPVKWIGRQTLHKRFTPAERFAPVRVRAGALGQGVPHSDLVLTADHALILDGLAVNAGALVNGTTITRDPLADLPERVTYYHVETEGHEIILANGATAETFVDYLGRRAFDNFAEYLALYGEDRTILEMNRPRVRSARHLPAALSARLAGGAAA